MLRYALAPSMCSKCTSHQLLSPRALPPQAANPELPMQQLLSLLELMWRDDDEDDAGQQAQQGQQAEQGQPAEQGQQQQQGEDQQQQQQQPQQGHPQASSSHGTGGSGRPVAPGGPQDDGHGASSSSTGVGFPLLRRGPRPAFDGHAVEPSPSAFAHWHPPAEWASAQHAQHAHSGPQHAQQAQQPPAQQQQPALSAEAQGLIDDEQEEGPALVHVPLDRVLPPRPPQ